MKAFCMIFFWYCIGQTGKCNSGRQTDNTQRRQRH